MIPDLARAPSSEVVTEGLLRGVGDLPGHIEHVRVGRGNRCFHAVLFVTATSTHEAEVVCAVIGFAAAVAIPSIRFAGLRPWPAPG